MSEVENQIGWSCVCVFVGCVCCTPTGNHTSQPPANFAQAPSGAGCARLATLAFAPPPPEGALRSRRTQLQNKLYTGLLLLLGIRFLWWCCIQDAGDELNRYPFVVVWGIRWQWCPSHFRASLPPFLPADFVYFSHALRYRRLLKRETGWVKKLSGKNTPQNRNGDDRANQD